MIGERFQHGEARGLLAVGGGAVEGNDFRGGVLFVDKGALEGEIDEAGDDVAGEGRDLAQDELGARGALQQIEHFVHGRVGLVDFIQKQQARDFLVFQLAHDELKLRDFLLVHLANHDGGIDRRQCRAHVVGEFHRAGTVQKGVAVAHEGRGSDRELDAHAVVTRFGAAVTHGVAGFHIALARDSAGAGEDRFKQCRLAALKGTDQRDTARSGRTRRVITVCRHDCLPAPARR